MASKPFIAARIPENLNLKLEEHSKATGEGRTQALINALAAYLGFTPIDENKEGAGDRLSLLEKKVAELENLLKEPRQISLLETSSLITKKPNPPKIKPDNKNDNEEDQLINLNVIKNDNEIDNAAFTEAEEKDLIDQPQQTPGAFIGRMKTQDIPKLPGLEDKDAQEVKIKLNNKKNTKAQTAHIGNYTIVLAVSTDVASSGKNQKLLWDVYKTEDTPLKNHEA